MPATGSRLQIPCPAVQPEETRNAGPNPFRRPHAIAPDSGVALPFPFVPGYLIKATSSAKLFRFDLSPGIAGHMGGVNVFNQSREIWNKKIYLV
jgi:hypothetical protein